MQLALFTGNMQNSGFHTFWTKAIFSLVVPFLLLTSACRLEEGKSGVKIYPENGATNVPVNTVIEIQFPSELGLTKDEMKAELFSVHECRVTAFDYLAPQKPAEPTAPATTENANADGTKDEAKKTEPEKSSAAGTKYLSKVNFFYANSEDKEKKIIFNYLLIDPASNASPLKPGDVNEAGEQAPTTYCVRVKKMKNKEGVVIPKTEISFTTEETASLEFSSKIQPEFFGNRLAVTMKSEVTGKDLKDFILINFRGQSVRPNDLKTKVTLCLQTEQESTNTDACKKFGEKVSADIYMLDGLVNEDGLVRSNYSLFAIAPRVKIVAGQKFKVVVNKDINQSEEANIGTDEAIVDVDEEPALNWHSAYREEVKDSSGKSPYTPHHQFFYIGSGS
jgi:hypothetical protein